MSGVTTLPEIVVTAPAPPTPTPTPRGPPRLSRKRITAVLLRSALEPLPGPEKIPSRSPVCAHRQTLLRSVVFRWDVAAASIRNDVEPNERPLDARLDAEGR